MSKSALMVIDVQKDVVANGFETERVVSNINSLISKARAAHVPVIWVQHSDDYLVKGSEGWNFVDELEPLDSDSRIYKTQPSSFEGTNLLDLLNVLGTNELVITGAQTDFCVNATSNAGVELGFEVVLVGDAHTTENTAAKTAQEIIAEKNSSFKEIGRVAQTSEISF